MDPVFKKEISGNELLGDLTYRYHPLDCVALDAVEELLESIGEKRWHRQDIAYFLSHSNSACTGLFVQPNGSPTKLASCFLGMLNQGNLDISFVATHSSVHRCGLAHRLLKRVLSASRVSEAVLEVSCENLPAISLYERAGFHTLEKLPRYYQSKEDAYLMHKAC